MRPHAMLLVAACLLAACPDDDPASPDAGAPDAAAPDAAGGDARPDGPAPDGPACPTFGAATVSGTVSAPAINETSGLAASSKNPGVLWLHNDSGDSARVFAIDTTGNLLGTYTLEGASAVDWEDMTLGPGPAAGTSYLYMGDIGDNPSQRASIAVYRVEEPAVTTGQAPVTTSLSGVETLPFVYPDGAHNAETLLADPDSGDLYIVVKVAATAGLYSSKAPQTPDQQRTLTRGGDVSLGVLITGGDISSDGSEILLRTYTEAWLWQRAPGASVAAALVGTPCKVTTAFEPQGEAIAFSPTTGDLFTLSEGTGQPLYHYPRN